MIEDHLLFEEECYSFQNAEEELGTEDGDIEEVGDLFEHFVITVDKGQSLLRIDRFLADKMPRISRNRIQMAADAGALFVNDRAVKSNYKVKPGDRVALKLERPPYELEIIPEEIPLDIVYEDPYLLVVNKQPGLVVHPGHGNYTGTLVNALAYHLRDDKNYDANDPRLGLVHRIDKETSGLLLVAKNAEVRTHLSRQFFNKTTRREYQTLVWGRLPQRSDTIRTNLGRDPRNRMLMYNFPYDGADGKTAVTHYEVLEELAYVSFVRCHLETGRTHQIRAHMKYLGNPVFNDNRYGGDEILRGNRFASYKQYIRNCFSICPRHALHAKSLGFYHPVLKKEMDFDSNLPEDMNSLLEKWRKYVATGGTIANEVSGDD